LYCATIENPSYGVKGGYRPNVKEFVIVPGTSRAADTKGLLAEKLVLDVVLVPSLTDAAIDPEDTPTGCGCSAPASGNGAAGSFAIMLACAAWLRRRRGGRR